MRSALPALAFAAVLAPAGAARASDLAADGTLVFAKDALATCSFESFAALQAAGANTTAWSGTSATLVTTPLAAGDEVGLLTGAADALEGGHGLRIAVDRGPAIALRMPELAAAAKGRVSVTMWGRAYGAEPVLQIVYSHNDNNVSPGLYHVAAIRTGRETSDGWVEYSTGPVDGTVFTATLRAVVLTARYATDAGASLLSSGELAKSASSPPTILDPTAYAVIDAVEVRPEPGSAFTPAATCTQATVDTACGPAGECEFGHCLDAAVVWGAVPAAMDHRVDLVDRWAFVNQHLHADRKATATAAATFAGAAAKLGAVTSPRGYFSQLNQLVVGLRDGHTGIGVPPSTGTIAYPVPDSGSGPLDVCLGVAENDLAGGAQVYAVFGVGSSPSISEKLQRGDVLTSVDGMAPDAWIAAVLPRFAARRANDPGADPSLTAPLLSKLLGRFAHTVVFSRCQPGVGCTALPDIVVGEEAYSHVSSTQGYSGNTLTCSLRYQPSVSTPPPDNASVDTVVVETVAGVTSVQFDGFEGLFTKQNGYHAWEDPWTMAFTGNLRVLADARVGHGGRFTLGKWLFHLLRGTSQPYAAFAMPRGAHDDPDPAWLFDPSWDTCTGGDLSFDGCNWTGGNDFVANVAAPLGEPARLAWVNGNDVSMNDIVPRLLSGRANFRVFGPHASQGAYGEVSAVPPMLPTWGRGDIQVLDMRFGATPAAARTGTWESGKGVPPDEVVVQKVSDMLDGKDTVLEAALTWVSQ